jgi:hypothetical protein
MLESVVLDGGISDWRMSECSLCQRDATEISR